MIFHPDELTTSAGYRETMAAFSEAYMGVMCTALAKAAIFAPGKGEGMSGQQIYERVQQLRKELDQAADRRQPGTKLSDFNREWLRTLPPDNRQYLLAHSHIDHTMSELIFWGHSLGYDNRFSDGRSIEDERNYLVDSVDAPLGRLEPISKPLPQHNKNTSQVYEANEVGEFVFVPGNELAVAL